MYIGRAVWPWASLVAVGKLYIASEPYGSGQAWGVWVQLGTRPGVGADVTVAYHR
jgi:hypothetical protein